MTMIPTISKVFAITIFKSNRENIGAKMLSTRLRKVLNLLIPSLTTLFCNTIEFVATSGEIRQRTTNEVQGNYPKT